MRTHPKTVRCTLIKTRGLAKRHFRVTPASEAYVKALRARGRPSLYAFCVKLPYA